MTTFLTFGPFGDAVAQKAARPGDTTLTFPRAALAAPELLDGIFEAANFVAVAAWRPDRRAFMAIEEAARRSATPWSHAVIDGTRLSIGPLTHPGDPGCYACHVKRAGTHHRAPVRQTALDHHYDRHPEAGPQGFTGPMVALAASALRGEAVAGRAAAGRLRIVDVLTGAATVTEVLPVHGCPSCFAHRAQNRPGDRFVRDLLPAIEEILR